MIFDNFFSAFEASRWAEPIIYEFRLQLRGESLRQCHWFLLYSPKRNKEMSSMMMVPCEIRIVSLLYIVGNKNLQITPIPASSSSQLYIWRYQNNQMENVEWLWMIRYEMKWKSETKESQFTYFAGTGLFVYYFTRTKWRMGPECWQQLDGEIIWSFYDLCGQNKTMKFWWVFGNVWNCHKCELFSKAISNILLLGILFRFYISVLIIE